MIGKKTRSFRLAVALSATLALAGTFTSNTIASRTVRYSSRIMASASRTVTSTSWTMARASRTMSVDDTGHLRLLKAFGSVLLEEGATAGTLPGLAKVRLTVGSTVTASFTIQTKYGTIYGSGRAALHSSGRYSSFGGSLTVNHGTGSYARAHGGGKLYGVIDRRTSSLTVQTVGTLSY